jgi:hypothetical protein
MAGLVPAIHVLAASIRKTWIPGTRPGMTSFWLRILWFETALARLLTMRERWVFPVTGLHSPQILILRSRAPRGVSKDGHKLMIQTRARKRIRRDENPGFASLNPG